MFSFRQEFNFRCSLDELPNQGINLIQIFIWKANEFCILKPNSPDGYNLCGDVASDLHAGV